MFEFLFEITFLSLLLIYNNLYIKQTSLLYLSITIDSLFTSIAFLKFSLFNNLSKSQTLVSLNNIYKVPVLFRYLYYIIAEISYYIFLILLNGYFKTQVFYLLLFSLCPIILNTIILKKFNYLFVWINNEINLLIKVTVAILISYLINFMSLVTLNLRPEIHYNELMPLFNENITDFFYSFLSSFAISTLIQYTKNNGNHIYAKIIRYFYNYKTGDNLKGTNTIKAKEKIINVIVHRKWSEFLKPDVTQSLFFIYKNNDENNLIQNLITKFHYSIIQISVIWSIVWFLKCAKIAPLLSIFFCICEYISSKKDKIDFLSMFYNSIILVIIFINSIHYNDKYLILSILSELGFIITTNTYTIITIISSFLYYKCKNIALNIYPKDTIFVFMSMIYIKIINLEPLSKLNISNLVLVPEKINLEYFNIRVLSYIYIIYFLNNERKILFTSLVLSCYLSDYNYIHLIKICLIISILTNIVKYIKFSNNDNHHINKDETIELFNSYYPKYCNNPNKFKNAYNNIELDKMHNSILLNNF